MKVGDKVLVRKPADTREGLTWPSQMDKYDGTVQEISERFEDFFHTDSSGYFFSREWLTPVTEYKGKYYRVADESDIGSPILVSDLEPEKFLGDGRPPLTLTKIDKGGIRPFVTRHECWKYGLVEVELKSGEVELARVDTPTNNSRSLQAHLYGGINCRTYEEKYALLEYLNQLGYRWYGGQEIYEYKWRRIYELGVVRIINSGVVHGRLNRNLPYFSDMTDYQYIMEKYAPVKASEPQVEFKTGSSRMDSSTTCIPKLECSMDSYLRSTEKTSEAVNNPAADAAKPQKESKMALLSLASKKVRGLVYGVLDWAFISPLKRTFKPVATIAQFSICYLTIAAAGYFAYGLYQNPQSVVEWISEISPVEIRLKNIEE